MKSQDATIQIMVAGCVEVKSSRERNTVARQNKQIEDWMKKFKEIKRLRQKKQWRITSKRS